eukprot:c26141_g1_i1.p1 GENE.c26141_g1_i1~~c26141_g1_i1.p1  ORF type:complete len:443 (+),score=101.08 c26141_g1_i1:143-1330(+)
MCGMFAQKIGLKSLSVDQQRKCCSEVHKFEANFEMNLISVESASQGKGGALSVPAKPTNQTEPNRSPAKVAIPAAATQARAPVPEPKSPPPLKIRTPPSEPIPNKTLLIAIVTAPGHSEERDAIRRTWMNYISNSTSLLSAYQKSETDIKFVVGPVHSAQDAPDLETKSKWQKYNLTLKEESEMYNDIIRLEGFVEDYSNLTLKSIALFDYAVKKNYTLVFKTDDDSFVRVDQLWRSFELATAPSAFISHCSYDFPTNQDPNSKNYMYDTYNHDTIPVLCHGGGYLLGSKLLKYIVDNQAALVHHRNEDAAVSIWLTDKDSQAPNLFLDPNMPVTFYWQECNPDSVYLNPMRFDDMVTVWDNIISAPHDPCARGFQLREFWDLLDQLSRPGNALL